MKVAVIGLGVMGKSHLRVLQSLDEIQQIVVQDIAPIKLADTRKVEVFDSLDFELKSGVLVAHKHGLGVLLKRTHRPHVINTFFDGHVKC